MPKGVYNHVIRYPHIFNDGLEHKRCGRCKTYFPLEMFGSNKRNKDGLCGECKTCQKEMRDTDKRREQNRMSEKRRYKNNHEHVLSLQRATNERNKEKILLQRKIRYKRPEVKSVKHEYDRRKREEKSPEYLLMRKTCNQRYVAKKKNYPATLTSEEFIECMEYFKNKDAYTGLDMQTVSQDHVIPLSKGGSYTRQNIIPCDISVNASKGNKDMETWYRKQSFFSEERLKKIKQWMGYKPNSDILQTAFF